MMTTKLAKWIFYAGTLSSLALFLLLTWDTHRQMETLTNADQLSPEVVAGKKAFQKYNCNDCHTILGFGAYYAPDLTKIHQRRGPDYIRRVLLDPAATLASSFRKMPRQNPSVEEVENMVTFFRWVGAIDTQDWPPQDAKKRNKAALRLASASPLSLGASLFKENGCFDCHSLGSVGGGKGPALDDVGLRLTAAKIGAVISNPQNIMKDATMPGYGNLGAADIQSMADFLASQKGGSR